MICAMFMHQPRLLVGTAYISSGGFSGIGVQKLLNDMPILPLIQFGKWQIAQQANSLIF
jgi:hypothetical protein